MAKNKQFVKVLSVLASGEAVTKEALAKALENSGLYMNRMSTYLWECRKAGAQVVVVKNGREVASYQLKNPEGFQPGWDAKPEKPAKVKAPKVAKTKTPKASKSAEGAVQAAAATKKSKTVKTAKAKKPTKAQPSADIGAVPDYAVDAEFDQVAGDLPDFLKN